jgi:hypothetical protein
MTEDGEGIVRQIHGGLRSYTSSLEAMPMASRERPGPQPRIPVVHEFARGHAHGLERTTGAPTPVIP